MGETRETIRLTMTVAEAKMLARLLEWNALGYFDPDTEPEDPAHTHEILDDVRNTKIGIKIQMALLRSQL